MSCYPWPEFATPKCSLVIDKLEKCNLLSDKKIESTIKTHLNAQVIHLISTNNNLVSTINEIICSSQSFSYYLVKNLPVYTLIHKMLINGYVKTGNLYVHSINTSIDFDDCLVVTNGTLVLSLKDHTYHRLGITGKKSILYRKKNSIPKHIVEIELTKDYFTPGTKIYQRTYECLERSGLIFDVLVKWEANEELNNDLISSMSIKNFFDYIKANNDFDLSSMKVFRCAPKLRSYVNNSQPLPTFSDLLSFDDYKQSIDWFGAQVSQIECNQSSDCDVSTFGYENSSHFYNINCIELSGFFSSSDILNMLTKLNDFFDSEINCVIVHGFENSVISWKGTNNEHGMNLSGESGYGFANIDQHCFIWRFADEYDFGIERI